MFLAAGSLALLTGDLAQTNGNFIRFFSILHEAFSDPLAHDRPVPAKCPRPLPGDAISSGNGC
jgi:hypothetical protein